MSLTGQCTSMAPGLNIGDFRDCLDQSLQHSDDYRIFDANLEHLLTRVGPPGLLLRHQNDAIGRHSATWSHVCLCDAIRGIAEVARPDGILVELTQQRHRNVSGATSHRPHASRLWLGAIQRIGQAMRRWRQFFLNNTQFEHRHTKRDIEPNRAFQRKRLQSDGACGPADQNVGAGTHTNANVTRRPHILARKRTARQSCGGSKDSPREHAARSHTEIETDRVDRALIGLWRIGPAGWNLHSIDWWPTIMKPMLGLSRQVSTPT